MPAPLIEYLIPAFNAARWAGPLIDSLRHQSNPRWHATIIDDGSTDATADTIEVTCRALGESRITIIRQPNTGVAAARDAALTHARAPFVCFLDADDLIDPHHAKSLLDALAIAEDDAAPSADLTSAFDAAACGYRLIDSKSVDLGWSTSPQPGDHTFARVLAANRSAIGTVAIRRAALLSIRQLAGGHLADIACLCEDWQLWLNVALHGPSARGWPQDPRGVRWAPPIDRPLLAYRQHPAARSHALRASMNDGLALITHYANAANAANTANKANTAAPHRPAISASDITAAQRGLILRTLGLALAHTCARPTAHQSAINQSVPHHSATNQSATHHSATHHPPADQLSADLHSIAALALPWQAGDTAAIGSAIRIGLLSAAANPDTLNHERIAYQLARLAESNLVPSNPNGPNDPASLARIACRSDAAWRDIARRCCEQLQPGQRLVIYGLGRNGRTVAAALPASAFTHTPPPVFIDDAATQPLFKTTHGTLPRVDAHSLTPHDAVIITPDNPGSIPARVTAAGAQVLAQ